MCSDTPILRSIVIWLRHPDTVQYHDMVQHRDAVQHQNTARYYYQLPIDHEEMNNAINQAGWHFPS